MHNQSIIITAQTISNLSGFQDVAHDRKHGCDTRIQETPGRTNVCAEDRFHIHPINTVVVTQHST